MLAISCIVNVLLSRCERYIVFSERYFISSNPVLKPARVFVFPYVNNLMTISFEKVPINSLSALMVSDNVNRRGIRMCSISIAASVLHRKCFLRKLRLLLTLLMEVGPVKK